MRKRYKEYDIINKYSNNKIEGNKRKKFNKNNCIVDGSYLLNEC